MLLGYAAYRAFFTCRHVTFFINKSELDNAPDGPKVRSPVYRSASLLSNIMELT